MESRVIERDGTRLHGLWRPGDGAPILVIPGVMADAAAFAPVIDAIARPEPVLIVDRRGRSHSGPLGEDYSVATEAADAAAWVDHLASPITLVGWSYGAVIALEVAARDQRVKAVVGYEPVLGPFGVDALSALRVADLDRRVEIVNLDVSLFPRERVDALRNTPVWADLRRLAAPLADELYALNAFDPEEKWAGLAAELILGELNVDTEPYGSAFERARQRMPQSRTTILAGQGHLAHADDPAALGQLIGALLDRLA